jgi:serine/threonine protein phosphatase PrpC
MDIKRSMADTKFTSLVLSAVLRRITDDKSTLNALSSDVDALNMTQTFLDFLYRKVETITVISKSMNQTLKHQPDIIRDPPTPSAVVIKQEFPLLESSAIVATTDVAPLEESNPIATTKEQVEQLSTAQDKPVSESPSSSTLLQPQHEPLKPGQTPASPSLVKSMPPIITAKFNLPNAKVGENYRQFIKGSDNFGREVNVIDMKIPDDLGLMFNTDKRLVTGIPTRSGDIKLSLRYEVASGEKLSGEMILIINPDPKSLWKVIEPDATLPFTKPHTEGKCIQLYASSQLVAASRRGRSHEHGGTFRDDDYFLDSNPAGWSVIIVADGAGSAKYSREGSRIAVTTAGQFLTELLSSQKGNELSAALESTENDKLNKLGTEFHYIFHQVCTSVVSAIEEAANGIGEQPRAFATTFLAAVVKPYQGQYFVASFWLGDGAIAIYEPNGAVKLMGSPDGGEYAGQTLFLDRSALSATSFSKRTKVSTFDNKSVLFLMTDGVSDPFFETDNGLADATKWKKLWDEIEPKLKESNPEQALTDWLHFFVPGHHDDRTIALLNTSNSHSK